VALPPSAGQAANLLVGELEDAVIDEPFFVRSVVKC
jgi:hypothetical protein